VDGVLLLIKYDFFVSLEKNKISKNPVKVKNEAKKIFCRVGKDDRKDAISGPITNPRPKVAIILPKYFGLSTSLLTSATTDCMTGVRPPNSRK
jgi:hypothetical protein